MGNLLARYGVHEEFHCHMRDESPNRHWGCVRGTQCYSSSDYQLPSGEDAEYHSCILWRRWGWDIRGVFRAAYSVEMAILFPVHTTSPRI